MVCAGRPAGGEYCVKHLTECAALGRPPCCCCCSPPRGLHLGFFSARPWWLRLPVHTARPGPAQQPRPSCALQTPAPAPPPGTHTGHRGTGDTVTGTNGAVVLTPPDNAVWCILYVYCRVRCAQPMSVLYSCLLPSSTFLACITACCAVPCWCTEHCSCSVFRSSHYSSAPVPSAASAAEWEAGA